MNPLQPPTFSALLRRHRVAAQLSQEALAERAGLHARTVSDLERGEKQAPHRETVRLLATALALSGDESTALEAAIPRRRRPRAGPAGLALVPAAGAAGHSFPLVGRGAERVLLHRHLAGEGPPLLALAGEPGIGKSRVLVEAGRLASGTGWTVLAGGCQRRGGQEPYAPLLHALAAHLHAQTAALLRTSLRDCAWLVRLLPELSGGPIEPLPAWSAAPEQERRLLFAAVARYLANVAGPRGTLLLLDDLQWAGGDALDLLSTLIGASASAAPLRVIGAYRDTEVTPRHPLAGTLADLAAVGRAAPHPLGPLAPAEAAQLLDTLLPAGAPLEGGLRARVVQRTGGVPFFLVSYAQRLQARPREGAAGDAEEEAPWDVAQGIRQRVSALSQDAQHVLSMAAVVGRRVPYALLSQVTAQDEDAVLAALESARQAGLLTEQDHAAYGFAHDLIREVLEDDLGAARRTMLHRRVAEALEQAPGEPPIEELAYHYGRSAEPDKAVRYLELAGDRAAAQYAHGMAEGYYQELVDHLDRLGRTDDSARAREKLGGVLATEARYEDALVMLERAAAFYRAAGDAQGELRAVARVGRAHAWRGTPAEGITRLLSVLEFYRTHRPSPALAAVHVVLARLFFYTGRYTEELAAAEQAARLATALNDERILAEAEQRRGVALMMLGRIGDALRVLEGAIPRAEAVGDLFILGRALVAAGAIHLKYGEVATSQAYRERAVVVAERLGDPAEIAFMLSILSHNLFIAGDWRQARHHCERALVLLASSGAVLAAAYPLHVLGMLCLAEGDEEEASRRLDECAALAERSGDLQAQRFAQHVLAACDVLAGHAHEARGRLEPLLDRAGLEESHVTDLLPMLAWAELERGAETVAGTIVQEAIRRATAVGDRVTLAEALRIGGMVARRQGRWAEAQQAFEEALGIARALGYPYEEGRALYEWGMMLICKRSVEGDLRAMRPQAHHRLEAALDIFRRLGARRDAGWTEQALHNLLDEARPRGE